MLLIRAVSFKGRPVDRELLGRFSETGGTIGRGENSTMVLPDPDRYISRTHATISFQAGGFVITDNGTRNPLVLNERAMGSGNQARLADGDRIQLGGYMLEVTLAAGKPSQVPAAAPGSAWPSRPSNDDPMGALGTPGSNNPFADLLGDQAERSGSPAGPGLPLRGEAISPRAEPRIPPPSQQHSDPLAGLHGPEPSIDELFGLTPSSLRDPFGPPQSSPPFAQPEVGRVVDPLEMLGGVVKPIPPPSIPDHGQELFTPFVPPPARMDPEFDVRVEPMIPAAAPAAAPAAPAPPAPAPSTPAPPLPDLPAPPASAVTRDPGEGALLAALLQGAGISDAHLPNGLTKETMEDIGKILREAIQGTLDLLRARGLTKSEMRADVTVITPMDNNPLKFSPTAEAALRHLLAPHVGGFLPPLRAMQEAYDDLRAHQFGFLAGMRAALDEVLARFTPGELERRLSEPTALDSLLPMNRKAKQWDLFVEHYEAIAAQAREDFNAVFGNAFRRAYDAQVKQLRAKGRAS